MSQAARNLTLDDMMSQEITTAVVRAMRETFAVEVIPGDYEIGEGMVSLVGDVSGVIGMVQDHLEGTLTISLSFDTVHDLLPQIIGDAVSITHEMTVDAVGEITNMIFGQIKSDLNKRGYRFKLGIPSVITGRGHFISQFHRGRYMIIPFNVNGHLFQVHVALHAF
ncbi:MAG: chemotaxis protein CheX [Alphaproteobacteria bacterium]|nr:chemotaxis protein CheX [Alphaproteobacteria bacterium]